MEGYDDDDHDHDLLVLVGVLDLVGKGGDAAELVLLVRVVPRDSHHRAGLDVDVVDLDVGDGGLEAVALRFFNVYGIVQRPDSAYAAVIPKFVEMMVHGKAPQVYGDGLQTRDFVHVNDVCNAILKFLSPIWYGEKHHVFNVATQTRRSLIDLIDEINSSLREIDDSHVVLQPIFGLDRAGDIRHSMADITRLKDATDWAPTVNFSDGIRELVVEAYKQNLQK